MEERSASLRRVEVEGVGRGDDVQIRVGTRYSRAPSGDDCSNIGVSISVKSGQDKNQ